MDNASILFARDHILTLSAIAVSIKSIIKLLALSLKVSANYCAPQDQFNITWNNVKSIIPMWKLRMNNRN